jgi:competence ComEA-like helix-hairpin-helix protein
MLKYALIFVFVILINCIYACSEGQVNINFADAEELDELYGIGSVKAEEIINCRPFDSVDDLINVKGIGDATLEKIKEQGLACVSGSDEEEESEENVEEDVEEISENKTGKNIKVRYVEAVEKEKIENKNIDLETIDLNPKNIKRNIDIVEEESNWTVYGLIAFFMLIVLLMLLKKREYKNEFRE